MSNTISSNYIGTNVSGTAALGNVSNGIFIFNATHNVIGGPTAGERNIVSGSQTNQGIHIMGGQYNTVIGNFIGVDASGTLSLSNHYNGVAVNNGAMYNIIGGDTPGERNLISGNGDSGVYVGDTGTMSNTVSGNYIGTDVTGISIISNTNLGIIINEANHNLIGGNTPAERNLISGNAYGGIILSMGTYNNMVKGNYIGTDVSGTSDLGNTSYGILFRYGAHDNLAENNLIAYTKYRVDLRPGPGIMVFEHDTLHNILRQNRIHSNFSKGILLRDGGNQELFPPILTDVTTNSVSGQAPPNSTVEIFSDTDIEGEGRYYHGSTTAASDGNFTFTQANVFTGTYVTATAIDSDGNTSEFSSAYEPLVDVKVIAIIQPKSGGKANEAVVPTVKIGNAGTTAETGIDVSVQASGSALNTAYGPPHQVVDLPALGYATLTFPQLTPDQVGNYQFVATVNLTGDQDSGNNVQTQTVTVSSDVIDLWTKDSPSDTGDIPTRDFWQSPDIWVRNQDDGGLEHQDPISGTTNYVYMIVRNRGTAQAGAGNTAKVYWHEPSLGIKCGDWAQIDTAKPISTTLLNPTTQLLKFSWTPTRTGHTCLHGEINSGNDPVVNQCDVPWDNNLSQRNVDIIPGGGGIGGQEINAQASGGIVFEVTNIKNTPKRVDIIVDVSDVPDANAVRLDLGSVLANRWASVDGKSKSQGIDWVSGTIITITNSQSGTIAGIPMGASESQTVTLLVNAPSIETTTVTVYEAIDAGPGVAAADAIVGGNTYIFNTETSDIYLPIIFKKN